MKKFFIISIVSLLISFCAAAQNTPINPKDWDWSGVKALPAKVSRGGQIDQAEAEIFAAPITVDVNGTFTRPFVFQKPMIRISFIEGGIIVTRDATLINGPRDDNGWKSKFVTATTITVKNVMGDYNFYNNTPVPATVIRTTTVDENGQTNCMYQVII